MTTNPARLEANRKNAALSTGPKSEAGRERASRNATEHGLFSKVTMTGEERAPEFFDLRERLRLDLRPKEAVQQLLLDRLVSCAWRLRRVVLIESVLVELDQQDRGALGELPAVESNVFRRRESTMEVLSRYEAGIERSFLRARRSYRGQGGGADGQGSVERGLVGRHRHRRRRSRERLPEPVADVPAAVASVVGPEVARYEHSTSDT